MALDHAYNAAPNVLAYAADARTRDSSSPISHSRATTPELAAEAVLAAVSERTRLVLLDHVTSATALVLPVAEIVAALADRGDRDARRWRPCAGQAQQMMAWGEAGLGLPWLRRALTEAGIMMVDSHIAADAEGRKANLSALDGVLVGLTGAQGGLADTGTLALVSGPERGRLASLLPPVHIALLQHRNFIPPYPPFWRPIPLPPPRAATSFLSPAPAAPPILS